MCSPLLVTGKNGNYPTGPAQWLAWVADCAYGVAMVGTGAGAADSSGDDLAAVERAMTALEGQRATLGDEVVETALAPLRERHATLLAPRSEQRRLVTVVFADLVDFTVLSGRLDAEDTREVVNAYFARWQEVIEEQGGIVEKFIGDAVMAVFGLEHSFEDDAQRAVRAALAMRDTLPELSDRTEERHGVRLHMRVGVDTGEVVVSTLGERAGHDFVAVGPTVNRASRLQSGAPVDQVLISPETHRQIRGRFSFELVPGLHLKGIEEPVDGYVVLKERPHGFRLDPARGVEGVESATVGRDVQLRFLQERLWDVKDEARWRVVTIVGDAGLGKSRLLQEFDAWLAESTEPVWWFRGRASQSGRNRPHGLLRDALTARLGIHESDTTAEIREKFEAGFATAYDAGQARRSAQLVGTWLGFDLDDGTEPLPTDPQALRDQGTAALAEYFARLSATAPVVLLLEDLHWADDGSLRWLDSADAVLRGAPVLVVATTRPALLEERPHWGEGLDHHVRLPLAALSRRESRLLVHELLRHVADLPADLVELVVDAADGNPFYIEELVTWLLDAGVVVRGDPHWFVVGELVRAVVVPSTLKGVLQSRLDALTSAERGLLQRASVVGRVFWDDAVARLAEAAEEPATLDTLRRREIVYEREVSAFDTAREFLFKHALLRDVAYDSVLRAHRERYHLRAAQWLAEVSATAGRVDEYAGLIAEHFERAHHADAAAWFLRASLQASSVYALEEAGRLLDRALDLVAPDDHALQFDIRVGRERLFDRLGDRASGLVELEAMAVLSPHLDPVRQVALALAQSQWAFQHSEYGDADARARDASATAAGIGRDDLVAEAELWRGKAATWADDVDTARTCLHRCVGLARTSGRPSLEGEGLRYLGMVASNSGRYLEALDLCRQSGEVFAAAADAEGETMALAMSATVLFNLGRIDDARAALEQSLPIFRRSGHRYRESLTLGNLASISMMQGAVAVAERWSREALAMAVELEDLEAQATDLTVLGMIESITARYDAAAEHLEQALAVARQVGSRTHQADALQRLAIAELGRGDVPAALDRARSAARVTETTRSGLEAGQARLALGYAASDAGLWEEAEAAFAAAAAGMSEMDLDVMLREARAGLAATALARGDTDTAVGLVRDLLPTLDQAGLEGAVSPGRVLHTAWRVLEAADDPLAARVLDDAHAYLRARAALVGDEELAAGYLRVPVHAELLRERARSAP